MRMRKRFQIALLMSLIFHSLLVTMSAFIKERPPQENPDQVEITFMDQKNLSQIVDQSEKPVNDEIDDNAKFLSQHNQRVQKQTVARQRGEFQNKSQQMQRFLPQFDSQKIAKQIAEDEAAKEAQLIKEMQEPRKAPTALEMAVSQTLDYIKELDPGLETMLSTREFVYYSYYRRIRNQLNQYWTPDVQETVRRIYATGRQLASDADRVTRCLVTLDRNGKLIRVQIIGQSGVRDLDEAAVRAFNSAAPFPNPPKGIVENDGTIRIRWDFILEA